MAYNSGTVGRRGAAPGGTEGGGDVTAEPARLRAEYWQHEVSGEIFAVAVAPSGLVVRATEALTGALPPSPRDCADAMTDRDPRFFNDDFLSFKRLPVWGVRRPRRP